MSDSKVKTLVNDIMKQCHEQGLTLRDVESVITLLSIRLSEGKQMAVEKALDREFREFLFRPY